MYQTQCLYTVGTQWTLSWHKQICHPKKKFWNKKIHLSCPAFFWCVHALHILICENICKVKFAILSILRAQWSGINCIPNVVQLSRCPVFTLTWMSLLESTLIVQIAFPETSSNIAPPPSYIFSFAIFARSMVSCTVWARFVISCGRSESFPESSVSTGLSFLLQFSLQLFSGGSCCMKLWRAKTKKKKKKSPFLWGKMRTLAFTILWDPSWVI